MQDPWHSATAARSQAAPRRLFLTSRCHQLRCQILGLLGACTGCHSAGQGLDWQHEPVGLVEMVQLPTY